MKLISVTLSNFRCYQKPVSVSIDSLTTLIGKNDIGKSSILEALEIFFNNDIVKIESNDGSVHGDPSSVWITCEFSDLPAQISLDSGAETTLNDEYLLTSNGSLKIQKRFDCSKKAPTCEIFILALHPQAAGLHNLLELKEKDLQALVKAKNLDVSLKGNPGMRQALWKSEANLMLGEVQIPVSKAKEDGKRIWEQIEAHLPIFALFQSDRSSRDSDDEVQDPMKAAISAAIAEVQEDIDKIQKKVQEKAEEIANRTHRALQILDKNLASELKPQFTSPTASKWTSLFSVNLNTENGIPLNKRGSGVRRLVLVSFFKAESERRLMTTKKRSIIYAIEEPETAQHPNNQRVLIDSFKSLSSEDGCQVLITTHSPGFASELPADGVRFIARDDVGSPVVQDGADCFGSVAAALGVVPDSRVRVLLCVEGPTDVTALKYLSRALHEVDDSIINLVNDPRVAFVVLGGGTLVHWVNEHYLKNLGRPEFHLYDNDVAKYKDSIDQINQRNDGSFGVLTSKHEIENYLHPQALKDAFGISIEIGDRPDASGKTVPKLFGEAFALDRGFDAPMGEQKSKSKLANEGFMKMTAELLRARDPMNEVESWLRKLQRLIVE